MRAFLSNDATFRYCLKEGRTSGQVHDSGSEGNIFRCVACTFLICTTHDEAMHVGETCEQYDARKGCERKVQNYASQAKIEEVTKICPGAGCGVRIE